MRGRIPALSIAPGTWMSGDVPRIIRLAIIGSVAILPLLVLPAMIGALIDHAGFSESEAGWVAAVGAAGSAIGAITLSFVIRHLDPRALAVYGLAIMGGADALSSLVAEMPVLLFLAIRFLSGLGGSAAYAAVMASFASLRDPERGYGVFMVFQFAISAAGLYLLPQVLPALGILGMYLGLAAVALATITQSAATAHRERAEGEEIVEVGRLLAPAAILVMLGIGLFETANNMHFTYAERIGLGYGLSLLRIGEILAVATLVGIPAGLSVAWLGDRVGQLLPIVFALLLSAAALYWLMQPAGTTGYFIVMCVLSFTWAFGLPFFQAFAARLDPGGSVVVAAGFFTSGGAAVGPGIAAMLVAPGDYNGVLLFAIGLYGIVAVLMLASRRLARIPAA